MDHRKSLYAPFLNGLYPVDFQEAKRPLRTTSETRPIKVGKQPTKEGRPPIKAVVLVGMSVGCLMGHGGKRPLKKGPLRGL